MATNWNIVECNVNDESATKRNPKRSSMRLEMEKSCRWISVKMWRNKANKKILKNLVILKDLRANGGEKKTTLTLRLSDFDCKNFKWHQINDVSALHHLDIYGQLTTATMAMVITMWRHIHELDYGYHYCRFITLKPQATQRGNKLRRGRQAQNTRNALM